MVKRNRLIIGLMALLLPAALLAQAPAEQQLSEEVQLALVRLIESGAFAGKDSNEIAFVLEEPARRVVNLGLLVDSASAERARDGLRVLGVTPRSSAQRMGIRAGDRITAVNGTSLAGLGADPAGHAQAAATLRTLVDGLEDGAKIEFAVQREDGPVTLSGALASIALPPIHLKVGRDELLADAGTAVSRRPREDSSGGIAGCGRFNVFDVAPRQQKLYGVKLLSIDGNAAGPVNSNTFRVSAGTHTLKIAEQIDDSAYRRFGPRGRYSNDDNAKSLQVTVKPNTTYYLAARFNEDARNSPMGGKYWDPVVWKEVEEDCH
jgi:PDZ domain